MEDINPIRRWFAEWRGRWMNIAGSAILRLGDAAGESKLSIRNSDDQEVFFFKSNGTSNIEPIDGEEGEALLRGGSRSLIGNLTVASGVEIDGVDISAFKGNTETWQTNHVNVGADPHALYARKQSVNYVSGAAGYKIDPTSGDAEFGNLRARGEFASSVFRINEINASAGTLGVYYSASTVHERFQTPSAVAGTETVTIRNSSPTSTSAMFAAGAVLQIKAWNGTSLVNAWFTVSGSPTAGTGYSTYTLKLESGSTSVYVEPGTAIVNWGPSGSGAITLSADGTIGSSPNLSVVSHSGSPWSANTLIARMGNLSGITDATFGSLSGNGTYISGNAYITGAINASSGVISGILSIPSGGEIRQGSGSLTSSPATFTGLRIWSETSGGGTFGRIAGYNSGKLQWFADTDGKLKTAGGQTVIDETGILLNAYQSEFPSGINFLGEYRFGRWTAASGWVDTDLAGLKHRYGFRLATTTIYNNDLSAYNRIEIDASAGSTGTIALKGTDIETWGTLWFNGATSAQDTNLYRLAANSLKTDDSFTVALGLNVGAATGAGTGEIKATTGTFSGDATAVNGSFSGGLNVGSATGATAGQVKASAGISGTTGTFSGAVSGTTGTFTSGVTATGAFQSQLVIGAANNAGSVAYKRGTNGDTTAYVGFISASDGSNFEFKSTGGGSYFTWNLAGAEKMRLSNAGYLGVLNNNPAYELDVTGDIRATGGLNVGSATASVAGQIKTTHSSTTTSLMVINRTGSGAQTAEYLVQSNGTNVGRFGWNASGYVDIAALNSNDSIYLTPIGTGKVRVGSTLVVAGDQGGVASTTGFTNATVAISTGTAIIKSRTTTNDTNSGFIKIFIGTTAYYIPYWP